MNKKDRETRNSKMIKDRSNGASIKELSEKYNITGSAVSVITRGALLTKAAKFDIRVKESGLEGVREWADSEGISETNLHAMCKSRGLKLPPKKRTWRKVRHKSKIMHIVAALQQGADCSKEWTDKLGVTKQYIELVKRQCEDAGVKL